ncbi:MULTISPECIES: hypothetical protein [unclassified Nostoc]|uniref:hypothetical protein n=1 Tax=unclassified Nostoc TaxID=2593658 RepID=UPI002AD4B1C4|nr:hypothetical protein [Nostoc sp. DedQUE03]MDZ7971124.1 hypothetical protein [Nostoc sp. DedQUE03]MDZ8044284.1 hypothetical protein [Nostoc sp. DedQUE02]
MSVRCTIYVIGHAPTPKSGCYSIIAYLLPTMVFYPTVGDRIPILLDYLDLELEKLNMISK